MNWLLSDGSAGVPRPQYTKDGLAINTYNAGGMAFHSVILRSLDEKAMPTFMTGRPSRQYFSA